MRRTLIVGASFELAALDDALLGFHRLYNVRPDRVLCAPDVLLRLAALTARAGDDALRRDLRWSGIRVTSAILAPGTLVLEGEVDDVKMGDW